MPTDDYNGWKNRATWNVVLWMNNDEGIYLYMRDTFRRRYAPIEASDAREFFEDVWPNGVTPDDDSLKHVDWDEVAGAINEDMDLKETA